MAERMSTRIRYDRIRDNGAISRTRNGHLKRKEGVNRDARMTQLIKTGTYPYTPAVQSWLSTKFGVRFREVTEEMARSLVK
jgi:hypothetical protein